MNLTICAPREACARQPCGGPDTLARVRMHAWTCLMAQIIHIYACASLCQALGPVRHAWAEPCMRVESAICWHQGGTHMHMIHACTHDATACMQYPDH